MEIEYDTKNPNVGYVMVEQGSQEWHDFRKSKITATGAYELLQGRPISEIFEEKQNSTDFGGNESTERGHLLENEARTLYSDLNQVEVREVGAVVNKKYGSYACSPDGLVGHNGGIEIKCFQEKRQEDVFKNLDPHIIAQIQFNLFLTEREWWDLVQYNPEVENIDNAYHCQRFYPDKEMFKKFEQAIKNVEDPQVEQMALEIINLESQLQKQTDEVKAQIAFYNQTKKQIEDLKQKLKENTQGKIKKTVQLGDDKLELSIYDRNTVSVYNPALVPKEYTTKQEITNANIYIENGKIYQDIPNTKLVSNLYKTGTPLPDGFQVRTSRSISIKFNKETL